MSEVYAARRQRLFEHWPEGIPRGEALLVSEEADRFYFSGFRGDAGWLVITPERALLLADGRFWAQAEQEAPGVDLVRVPTGTEFAECLPEVLAQQRIGRLCFQAEHVSWAEATAWHNRWTGVELVATEGLGATLRLVKGPTEVDAIRRAAQVTDAGLADLLPLVVAGATEGELAAELEYRLRRRGAEAMAFPPIIAAGPRGALPHARPGSGRVGSDDLVVIDLGARFDGYCADMTRTVIVGQPDPPAMEIFAAVERALQAGLAALRPGVTGWEVDRAARGVIEQAGFGPRFSHGTGHGVGLWIHEAPRLSVTSKQVIPAGAVVTVEPGIYLPGRFGVRLEELVYVGAEGIEVLSRSPLRSK